jgi:hypothetical protein
MAEGNVILKISSAMGPGGLASLQAGISMVGRLTTGVTDFIREADKFAMVMENVDMKMVNYADSAAKGQVDTYQLMKSLNEIQHAFANTGATLTAEDFKILSTAATDLSQKTGKDATQAFKQLSDSVSKGTTRALKEYGIYIKQGTDLGKTHEEILAKLRESYGDVTINISRVTQHMDRFSNNVGTLWSAAIAELTSETTLFGKAMDAINDELDDLATGMSQGSLESLKFSASVEASALRMWDLVMGTDMFNKKLDELVKKDRVLLENVLTPYEDQGPPLPPGYGKTTDKKKSVGKRAGKHGAGDIVDISQDAWQYGEMMGRSMGSPEELQAVQDEWDAMSGGREWSATNEYLLGPEKIGDASVFSGATAGSIAAEMDRIDVERDLYAPDMQSMSVEDQMERQEMAEQRAEEVAQWMQSMDDIWQKEQEILDWKTGARTAELEFAQDFGDAWVNALERTSAGIMAAEASMQILRATWNEAVKSIILGEAMTADAFKQIVHEIGMAIAQEAGWHALMEFAHAIASAAAQDYGAAAQHAIAGALYTALAVAAGAASAATAPSSTASARSSMSAAGYGDTVGGYNESYGGNSGNGEQRVVVEVRAADEMFDFIVEENGRRVQSGQKSFSEANAA